MIDDYFKQNKLRGTNRGADTTPEAQEKWFATLDHEQRSLVLDQYGDEDARAADQPLSLDEAYDGAERRHHVTRLRQIHETLRRYDR